MTEADDKLLKQFFKEQKQEIADEGFSRRVIMHLPDRASKLSNLWVSFCLAIAVVLFCVFDGFFILSNFFREAMISIVQHFAIITIDLKSLIIVAVVLLLVGLHRLFSME